MALASGTRLGPYEVLSPIGVGGMGEVYRARDTRLKREVAIKVLPTRLQRPRPARPIRPRSPDAGVAESSEYRAIHGLEEPDGVRALVMELVEGDDLSHRIARGAIPLDEALPIARQIAEALEAAHEQGIIHRDLKPANIKLRPDGTVKVLDFGLAKALAPEAGTRGGDHRSQSPTITSPAMMTGVGIVLGTASYMGPEQAKGLEGDKRTDIWAFGCVLFEMLTGRRAFDGEDMTDVLAAVACSPSASGGTPVRCPLAGPDVTAPMPGQGPSPTCRRHRGRALRDPITSKSSLPQCRCRRVSNRIRRPAAALATSALIVTAVVALRMSRAPARSRPTSFNSPSRHPRGCPLEVPPLEVRANNAQTCRVA